MSAVGGLLTKIAQTVGFLIDDAARVLTSNAAVWLTDDTVVSFLTDDLLTAIAVLADAVTDDVVLIQDIVTDDAVWKADAVTDDTLTGAEVLLTGAVTA